MCKLIIERLHIMSSSSDSKTLKNIKIIDSLLQKNKHRPARSYLKSKEEHKKLFIYYLQIFPELNIHEQWYRIKEKNMNLLTPDCYSVFNGRHLIVYSRTDSNSICRRKTAFFIRNEYETTGTYLVASFGFKRFWRINPENCLIYYKLTKKDILEQFVLS